MFYGPVDELTFVSEVLEGQHEVGKKPAGRGRPRSVSAVLTADVLPKKRKQWRDEDMNAAIHAVHDGQLKVTEAAKKLSVPRQTLGDKISGKIVHGTKPGPQPYLSIKEES